ncbi:hypothetical protein H0H81_001299 [Sphagnurus paluster]|uniref:Piwi domain-containing protein n=1 Tax=Sphagnurus paluster TaxID=117069 RepID=A0A9P7G0E3_9AGAR|nr:hypothetical protein H0H81_001299 [Sphagnurus paluster]
MGADVIHPAPGSDGRPSFTALVANVDSESAKYIACKLFLCQYWNSSIVPDYVTGSRVQTSRQEMIEDLEEMSNVSMRTVETTS